VKYRAGQFSYLVLNGCVVERLVPSLQEVQ